MSSFKPYKRRKSILPLIWWALGTVVGICVVWFIVRVIVDASIDQKPLASATTIYNTALPKGMLVTKINELQTTLESYDAQLTSAKLLALENDQLKSELGRTPRPSGVIAHAVTLPNRSFYDTFVIDAGVDAGIVEGQSVYAFDTIALGTISDVSDDHATVLLYSAPGRTTSGNASMSNVAVTLIGRGGGEYEVRMPRDVPFEVGGLIAEQSIHTAVLAEIERIATDPRDPFQKLYAKAPINLQALKWVIVR